MTWMCCKMIRPCRTQVCWRPQSACRNIMMMRREQQCIVQGLAGFMTPKNQAEIMFTLVCMICTLTIYSYVVVRQP